MGAFQETRSRLPGWPLWTIAMTIALVIAVTLVGAGLLGIVLAAVGGVTGHDLGLKSPVSALGSTVAMDFAMVAGALVAVRMAEGRLRLGGFGFLPLSVSRRRAVALVVATWGTFLLFTAAWSGLVGKPGKQKIVDQLGADQSAGLWVAALVMIGIVAPFAEEFLFRGAFLSTLWGRLPFVPSALVTGLMFGALHIGGSPLKLIVPLAFLGFMLCVLRAATGSIVPCIAAHSLNNSIAFGVTDKVPAIWVVVMVVVNVSAVTAIASAIVARTYTDSDEWSDSGIAAIDPLDGGPAGPVGGLGGPAR